MGSTTGISWTDATWNPVRGCSRVSEGCRHCYAETTAARFSGPGLAYEGLAKRVGGEPRWTGEVRFAEEHLADPLRWTRPRRIFVNSMSDLFHEKVADAQIAAVFGVMAASPKHTFQVLTKRPERAAAWFEWVAEQRAPLAAELVKAGAAWPTVERACEPLLCMFLAARSLKLVGRSLPDNCCAPAIPWPLPNVWLGVSCENQAAADERIPLLLRCPAAVRWVSAEPLLGPVELAPYLYRNPEASVCPVCVYATNRTIERTCPNDGTELGGDVALDWVVVGGESGKGARPCDLAWIRSIRDQCRVGFVPFFVKQVGSNPLDAELRRSFLTHRRGEDPEEWPEDLRVREFPQERQVPA